MDNKRVIKHKPSGKYPKVTILLLNYNGWTDALDCLESIYQITYPNWELLFVDNGSVDGSISKIKEWILTKSSATPTHLERKKQIPFEYLDEIEYYDGAFHSVEKKRHNDVGSEQKVSLLRIEKNHGFSGGNNIGIKYILQNIPTDHILLVSNDIIVKKNFLDELITAANSDKNIGITGCKLINIDGTLQNVGQPSITDNIDRGQHDYVRPVDFTPGACMLIKRNVFDKVGLLDEIYNPAYFEDADYCLRVRRAGFLIMYVGKATVLHKLSKTTFNNKSKETAYFYTYCSKRNYFIYHFLHYPYRVPKVFLFSLIGSFVDRKNKQNDISINNLKLRSDFLKQLICFTRAFKDAVIRVSLRKYYPSK